MTFVSLPFHIQRISTTDPAATLRWTGWILGITSLVTVWLYGGLRFLQVLSIAPVFPLVVARLAQHARGAAIGLACVPLLTMREAGARA